MAIYTSNVVSVTPNPAAARSLVLTVDVSGTNIVASWTAPAGETAQRLYQRNVTTGQPWQLKTSPGVGERSVALLRTISGSPAYDAGAVYEFKLEQDA